MEEEEEGESMEGFDVEVEDFGRLQRDASAAAGSWIDRNVRVDHDEARVQKGRGRGGR